MPQKHWKLVVTRETTLLERYLRMIRYAGGVGKISQLRIGNILTISRDCVSEQYFDEREIKKCAGIATKEFKTIPQDKLFGNFGNALLELIHFTKRLHNTKQFSSEGLFKSLTKFLKLYGYGRGIILYAHFAEEAFAKNLKEQLALLDYKDDAVFRTITAPTDAYKKSKKILDAYYKPYGKLKGRQQKALKSLSRFKNITKTAKHIRWLSYYHELAERVTSQCFGELEHILQYVSRKTFVPLADLKFYTPTEIEKLLLKTNHIDPRQIKMRKQLFVLYMNKGVIKLYEGSRAKIVADRKISKQHVGKVGMVSGQVAQPGKTVFGKVTIVRKQEDMSKMKKGDVLVSPMTTPRLMPAVKLAKAIVTDEGGVTCHAAIVSRELGIPSVIGTKIATQIFKDGDIIEVDANKGIVKKV